MKNLPYEKTVVTEVKITLADLLTRNVLLKNSVAAAIPVEDSFRSGDMTITQDAPLQITGVKNCLILSSFQDFVVIIRGESEDVYLPCRGLFIHNGSINSVWVKTLDGVSVRLQAIWS